MTEESGLAQNHKRAQEIKRVKEPGDSELLSITKATGGSGIQIRFLGVADA